MKLVLLIFILLVCSIVLAAQTTQRKINPHPSSQPAKSDRNNPFDSNAQKLPPNFQGNNPTAIIQALSLRASLEKRDEFETTEQFVARLAKLRNSPYLGNLRTDSILGFVLPMDAINTVYNADTKLLLARIELKPDERLGCNRKVTASEIDCRALTLIQSSDIDSYIGQNGFGAVTKVKRIRTLNIGLDFYGPLSLPRQDVISQTYQMNFAVDVPFAISIKTYVRAVVIGTLSNTNVMQDFSGESATISSPTQVLTVHFRLHFIVKEIWFFNGTSGEIYGRLDQKAIDTLK